ncbi:MAG TPA: SCP2 sterol-binding domain-containing protein [Steroidobacteraceae bacterium]|jgi:ubiquinone biosynthesis protein UbiJ|nr:SCP2 sterol-binding domain-containing protein [Steroidobacteraceae bacterium]
MPATPAWLASVEALLNRNIEQSVEAAAAARRLNGTSLQIDIDGVQSIRAAVCAGRLALAAGGETAADAGISGSPLALFELLKSGMSGAGAMNSKGRAAVQIRGDAEIAGRYRELIAAARPDFEEELSRLVGDVPARRLSQFALAALAWARKTGRTAGENLAEYLQEESRDLVNKPELEEYLQGVDQAREAADRVEARLARLEQRLKGT